MERKELRQRKFVIKSCKVARDKVSQQCRITIPKDIADYLGIEDKDMLMFGFDVKKHFFIVGKVSAVETMFGTNGFDGK